MRWSIRRTLVIGTVIAVVAVLGAAGLITHRGVRTTLLNEFDRSLEAEARLLASTVDVNAEGIDWEHAELDMRDFEEGAAFLQLTAGAGGLFYRSPSLGDQPLADVAGTTEAPGFAAARLGDRSVRVVGFSFYPRVDVGDEDDDESDQEGEEETAADQTPISAPLVQLTLARDTAEIDAVLTRVGRLLAAVGGAAALLVAGLLGAIIRRALGPLNRVAREIGTLSSRDLERRFDQRDVPPEMVPIVQQLNQLLGRVSEALERERAFSADVAHELRTPLAGLRSTIEVAMARAREPGEYVATLRESLAIVNSMQELVESTLYLCRLESDQVNVEERPVELVELIHHTWSPIASLATTRDLDVQWSLPARAPVVGDPALLSVAIRNLLENAVTYADEGGYVKVRVVNGGARTRFEVVNSGSKVDASQVERLAHRFVRADQARSGEGNHCGLGLALVHRIASLLEISVEVRSRAGGDFGVALAISSA